jgi:hypothetical protein
VGYRNVEPRSIMLCPEKNLVRGGTFPTTLFLGLQMRKKAKINVRKIDTTTKLEKTAFQICIS